jgi:hypothetical protein
LKQYIKIPQYAKHRKVTPEYIRRLIKSGKIPEFALKRHGKRWLVDPEKADAALEKNLSYVNRKNGPNGSVLTSKIKPELTELEKRDLTLAECQLLHQKYKAALAELEFKQRSGELLPADEIKAAAFEVGRSVRDSIMNIPPRLGPILAGESDPNRIVKMLNDEFRKALEQLTHES